MASPLTWGRHGTSHLMRCAPGLLQGPSQPRVCHRESRGALPSQIWVQSIPLEGLCVTFQRVGAEGQTPASP